MPAPQLAGTTVLVSGASRNRGRAIAIALAKQGAHAGVANTSAQRAHRMRPDLPQSSRTASSNRELRGQRDETVR